MRVKCTFFLIYILGQIKQIIASDFVIKLDENLSVLLRLKFVRKLFGRNFVKSIPGSAGRHLRDLRPDSAWPEVAAHPC
jgi:hypothetical protein